MQARDWHLQPRWLYPIGLYAEGLRLRWVGFRLLPDQGRSRWWKSELSNTQKRYSVYQFTAQLPFPAHNKEMTRSTRRHHVESLEPRLALSVTLLNETFDDDAVDSFPDTADFSANGDGPEGFIQVGGPGGAYGTPIPPSGNKSLVFDNPGQAQPIVVWSWAARATWI